MISSSLKTALLVQILFAISEVTTESECSDYFRYARVLSTNETIGIINIPSPPGDVDWHLSVHMYVNARLLNEYKGSIQFRPSTQQSIPTVQKNESLEYQVYFPLQQPLPAVYSIMLNNRQLCFTPPATGAEVTLFNLSHSFYQPVMRHIPGGEGNIVYPIRPEENHSPRPSHPTQTRPAPSRPTPAWPNSTWPTPAWPNSTWSTPIWPSSTWPSPTPPAPTWPSPTPPAPTWSSPTPPAPTWPPPTGPAPTPSAPIEPLPQATTGTVPPGLIPGSNQDSDCSRNNNHVDQSAVVGKPTSIDQWPWLVGIFVRTTTRFMFRCSGTLVSNNHIVTAAHCFRWNKDYLPAGVFHVSLGRNHLQNWRERGSKNRNIARYKLHPDYNPTRMIADADLAIIVLRKRVQYSERIKPISLWSGNPKLVSVEEMTGFVVGWGKDENGNKYYREPRMTMESIVYQEDCLRGYPAFASSTSTRTFCTCSTNKISPWYSDCGSGLVVYNSVTNRYYLRGVRSVNLCDNVTESCEDNHYSIYVNIAKHLQWVRQEIATEELSFQSRNKEMFLVV